MESSEAEQVEVSGHRTAPATPACQEVTSGGRASSRQAPVSSSSNGGKADQVEEAGHQAPPAASAGGKVTSEGDLSPNTTTCPGAP